MGETIWRIAVSLGDDRWLRYECADFAMQPDHDLKLKDVRILGAIGRSPEKPEGTQVTLREGDVVIGNVTTLWTRNRIAKPDWWDK